MGPDHIDYSMGHYPVTLGCSRRQRSLKLFCLNNSPARSFSRGTSVSLPQALYSHAVVCRRTPGLFQLMRKTASLLWAAPAGLPALRTMEWEAEVLGFSGGRLHSLAFVTTIFCLFLPSDGEDLEGQHWEGVPGDRLEPPALAPLPPALQGQGLQGGLWAKFLQS